MNDDFEIMTRKETGRVQAIKFEKDYYPLDWCKDWLKAYGYKYEKFKEDGIFYIFEQFEPKRRKKKKPLKLGIHIIGIIEF